MEEKGAIDKNKVKEKLLSQYWELLKQEVRLEKKNDKKLSDKIDKIQQAIQQLK